jgi:Ca2+-transporting ATPase
VHIAFLEMVIDPVCTLVFEAETAEQQVMRRPPRPPEAPLFSRALIVWGLLQGMLAFTLVGTIFIVAAGRGMPPDEVRALAFFTLVLAIVAMIFANRSFGAWLLAALRRPNPALGLVLIAVAAMLALTLAWPFTRALFRFGPLHADDLAVVFAASVALLVVLELLKPVIGLIARGRRKATRAIEDSHAAS